MLPVFCISDIQFFIEDGSADAVHDNSGDSVKQNENDRLIYIIDKDSIDSEYFISGIIQKVIVEPYRKRIKKLHSEKMNTIHKYTCQEDNTGLLNDIVFAADIIRYGKCKNKR